MLGKVCCSALHELNLARISCRLWVSTDALGIVTFVPRNLTSIAQLPKFIRREWSFSLGRFSFAGLTIPSSAAGYVAIGVFTVLVPPDGREGGDAISLSTQADRQAAVREAWRQEAERARNGQPMFE